MKVHRVADWVEVASLDRKPERITLEFSRYADADGRSPPATYVRVYMTGCAEVGEFAISQLRRALDELEREEVVDA